jgi:hypothetical protein
VIGLKACAIAGAVVLVMVGAAGVKGYWMGEAAEAARWSEARAKLQDDLFAAAEQHSRAAAELAQERADRETLAMEFEDAARADPSAADRRPSPDSLRRLENLWRSARGTP